MTRVDCRPRCPHGVATADYCAACTPPRPRPEAPDEERLVDKLARLGKIERGPGPLHLPPTPDHVPSVMSAKGRLTVMCSCHAFRESAKASDVDQRHTLESAWGRHRA